MVVVAAALEQARPAPHVLQAHPRREPVEDRRRQRVERLVPREEVAHLGELGGQGHAAIVAACRGPREGAPGPERAH